LAASAALRRILVLDVFSFGSLAALRRTLVLDVFSFGSFDYDILALFVDCMWSETRAPHVGSYLAIGDVEVLLDPGSIGLVMFRRDDHRFKKQADGGLLGLLLTILVFSFPLRSRRIWVPMSAGIQGINGVPNGRVGRQ
jgi:hypothetical protein